MTCVGTPVPIVSASRISSGPNPCTVSAAASTVPVGTRPSKGQPNDAPSVTVTRRPSARARSTIRPPAAIASATVTPWLRSAKVSVTGKA